MMDDRSQTLRTVGLDPAEDDSESVSDWRRTERVRQGYEEAFEHLLGRCRGLEGEKLEWIAERRTHIEALATAQRSADDRAAASERQCHALEDRLRASADRVQDLEASDGRHRDAALAAARSHQAERDRMADAHASALAEVETREEAARHDLARAEESFRIEAYRLSALVVLRSKQAEAAAAGTEVAAAEVAAARHQLALLVASSSWRLTRPLRVLSRLIRRAGRAPRRLARAMRSRS